jgi:hypothetical protein
MGGGTLGLSSIIRGLCIGDLSRGEREYEGGPLGIPGWEEDLPFIADEGDELLGERPPLSRPRKLIPEVDTMYKYYTQAL